MALDLAGEIKRLKDELGGIPLELRQKLRPALKAAVQPIAADAKARASWSTRIPRAISVGARFGRDPGVLIRVRRKVAPHGRAYEGITGASHFVHPVYGRRNVEVAEETRPYLEPAVRAASDDVLDKVAGTVDEVAREHGFR